MSCVELFLFILKEHFKESNHYHESGFHQSRLLPHFLANGYF